MHPMPEQVSGVTPMDGSLSSQPIDLSKARRRLRNKSPEVISRKPDPRCWAEARRLADGDTSRLAVHEDGSVVVHNGPVR